MIDPSANIGQWFIVALLVVLGVFVLVVLTRAIRIVPQATAGVVERLGKYHKTLMPGLNILVPFIDRMRPLIDMREQVVSFPPQPVITEDNLTVNIASVIYYQVTDPKAASYEIADYIQAYGVGGLRAKQLGVLDKLSRVYWYTVEFGLLQQQEGLRIYGAGIASSATETVFALDDASPNRLGFEVERVMRTHYRIDDLQETYFVIRNLEQLLELAHIDFGPIYARVEGQPEHEPGAVLPTDRVLSRGSGRHHAARRKEGTP